MSIVKQPKKSSILNELQSAIKRKTHEKNVHREIANKNLQCSIDKKKANISRQRLPSRKEVFHERTDKPISILNNENMTGHYGMSQKQKEANNQIKLKKFNNRKMDKLISLINYALSSAEKIIKYMHSQSFQGQFAIKLFRSDKQNLLNEIKNLTIQDIINEKLQIPVNLQNSHLIIELQQQNSILKNKLNTLSKEMQMIQSTGFDDIYTVKQINQGERYRQTLQILCGSKLGNKIHQIMEKESKFQLISLKSNANSRKISQIQAILKSLKSQRLSIIKEGIIKEKGSIDRVRQQLEGQLGQFIRKIIKPKLNNEIKSDNPMDILQHFVSEHYEKSNRSYNNHESKESLKQQILQLRQKFQEIQGKTKIYQENELLKANIQKIYYELRNITEKYTNISQEQGFEVLLTSISEKIDEICAFNEDNRQNPQSYKQKALELQEQLQHQKKTNQSLKKLNASILEEIQYFKSQLEQKTQQNIQSIKLKQQNLHLRQQVQQLEEDLQNQLKENTSLFNELNQKYHKCLQELKKYEALLEQKQIQNEALKEKYQEYQPQQNNQQKQALKQRILELEEEIEQKISELEKRKEYISILEEQYRKSDKEKQQKIKQIQNQLNQLLKQKQMLQCAHSQIKIKIQEAAKQNQYEKQSLKDIISELQEKVKIPSNQSIEKDNSSSLQKQLEQLRNDAQELKKYTFGLEEKNQELSFLVNQYEQKKQQWESYLQRITRQKKQLAETLKHQYQNKMQQVKQQMALLKKTNEKLQYQILDLRQQLLDRNQQVENLKQNQQQLQQEYAHKKLNQMKEQYQTEIINLKQKVIELETTLTQAMQTLNSQRNIQIQASQQLTKLQKELNGLSETTSQQQKQLADKIEENLAIKQQYEKLRQQKERNENQIEILKNKINQLKSENENLKSTLDSLKQSHNAQTQQHCNTIQSLKVEVEQLKLELQEISQQNVMYSNNILQLNQKDKKRQKKIQELSKQKAIRQLNEKQYCNIIKRILRSMIDIQEFENIQNLEILLQLGSQKVMQERKRKRQQQSNLKRKIKQQRISDIDDDELKMSLFSINTENFQRRNIAQPIENFLKSQTETDKQSELKLSHYVQQTQNRMSQDKIKQIKSQQLSISHKNNQEKKQNQEMYVEHKSISPKIENQRQNLDEFQEFQQNQLDSSMMSNQGTQNQANKDISQFQDAKSDKMNESMMSNQGTQNQANKDISQFQDAKSDKMNESMMSNQGTQNQANKDISQFQDAKSDKMNESMMSNQGTQNQANKDISQFEDAKSDKMNESMMSNQDIQNQKIQTKNLSQFQEIKNQNLNDSIFSQQQILGQKHETPQKQNVQASFTQFEDFKCDANSSMMSETNKSQQLNIGQISTIEHKLESPNRGELSKLEKFLQEQ